MPFFIVPLRDSAHCIFLISSFRQGFRKFYSETYRKMCFLVKITSFGGKRKVSARSRSDAGAEIRNKNKTKIKEDEEEEDEERCGRTRPSARQSITRPHPPGRLVARRSPDSLHNPAHSVLGYIPGSSYFLLGLVLPTLGRARELSRRVSRWRNAAAGWELPRYMCE